MIALTRVTIEYIDIEDRIRLSGEVAEGQTMVLWLTQRMLNRVVPHACAWLANKLPVSANSSLAEIQQSAMQSFAQQAALARLSPEQPVAADAAQQQWRVHSVDVTAGDAGIRLAFKGDAGESAGLTMPAEALRQWLAIVHSQYVKADWPTGVWPEWIGETQKKRSALPAARLH